MCLVKKKTNHLQQPTAEYLRPPLPRWYFTFSLHWCCSYLLYFFTHITVTLVIIILLTWLFWLCCTLLSRALLLLLDDFFCEFVLVFLFRFGLSHMDVQVFSFRLVFSVLLLMQGFFLTILPQTRGGSYTPLMIYRWGKNMFFYVYIFFFHFLEDCVRKKELYCLTIVLFELHPCPLFSRLCLLSCPPDGWVDVRGGLSITEDPPVLQFLSYLFIFICN